MPHAPAGALPPRTASAAPPRRGREEQFFEREAVLGRDATSVFPTEAKKAAVEGAGLAELLGANKKFISETEVGAAGRWAGVAGRCGRRLPRPGLRCMRACLVLGC